MNPLNRQNPGWKAVADLGTNTFQLLVGKVENGKLETIFRCKTGSQIGKGGMRAKQILPDALERAIQALLQFSAELGKLGLRPDECIVLATSAFRNAENQRDVVEAIQKETGFPVWVISGELEADLIFKGVLAAGVIEPDDRGLIIDIGGGSVEFILCHGHEPVWRQSFEVGGLRLMEKFHQSDPISEVNQASLKAYFDEVLEPLRQVIREESPNVLIGSSGSFDTLVDMASAHHHHPVSDVEAQSGYSLSVSDFHFLKSKLILANRAARLAMPGMIPLRVDMIVVAVLLIQYVFDLMRNPQIRVSTFAMKEGAFFHEFNSL